MFTNRNQRGPFPFLRTGLASVRVLHAGPGIQAVDIYINGKRILREFSFKKSHNYLSLPPGKYQVDIYPAGTTISTLISKNVILESGKFYTMAAINKKLLTFEDLPAVPINEAKIRFIHLLPDAPALDIAVKARDVIFSKVNYRKPTSYLGVNPITLDLEARASDTGEVVHSLPPLKLKPNIAYSAFLVGRERGDSSFEVILLPG